MDKNCARFTAAFQHCSGVTLRVAAYEAKNSVNNYGCGYSPVRVRPQSFEFFVSLCSNYDATLKG
jgi:hypothetical protein